MPALEADAERYRTLAEDPRLITRNASEIFAWRHGQPITCGAFLGDVARCMVDLPKTPYLINLCTDRYRFSVAFFAAAVLGKTTLLPSQRNVESVLTLRQSYAPCRVIADNPDTHCDQLIDFSPGENGEPGDLSVALEHTAAIAFTSGSTGTPQAHPKSWRLLCAGRATHARYLARSLARSSEDSSVNALGYPRGLIATVPSWHMYGLEWAMLLPTIAPLTIYCGPDFFPGDVVSALGSFEKLYKDQPSILVSTPVHLKALLKSPAPRCSVATTLSATSPLDAQTASATGNHLNTRVLEIYGCSEVGSLAVREPENDREQGWEFFDIFDVNLTNDSVRIESSLLDESVVLADRFGPSDNDGGQTRLQLLGRALDLVKVAGKRESLARLNSELLALPGVDDGVIYQPESLGIAGGERLAAFVVGDDLDPTVIRQELASRLDPAFVPRPIRQVNALPRDATSKLSVAALRTLAESFADG